MHTVLASAVNHPDPVNPHVGLFNHRILRSIDDLGLGVDVVSPRPFAPPTGPYSEFASISQTEQWGPYTVHHPRFLYGLPKRLFYGLAGRSFAKRVPRYVEREFAVPDVVHACHIYLDGYGMLPYCRRYDLPLFVVAHGALLNTFDDLPAGVRSKVTETLSAATGVICVSDELARHARRHVATEKIETVPIGADPDRFPVDREPQLRAELDIDPETTVVLFVGEFCDRKGIPEICDVLPEMDADGTQFVFVGHGGDREADLRAAVTESDHSARHVYTGITSVALRRWLAVADLLLLPSRAEGRPTVVYEAMASETAVLGSTVGGIPEQVVDGETGVLIPPRDAATLAAALADLVADRDRLRTLGANGRDRLTAKEWTWTGHARRVRALHESALA